MFWGTEKPKLNEKNNASIDVGTTEKIELLNLRSGLRRAIFKRLDEETGISPELLELTRILVSTYTRDAARDFARGYLPAACDESDGGEFYYNVRGEKVYSSQAICSNKEGM